MEKRGYVYILANGIGNVLYVGVTSDLKRRVWEHKNRVHRGFTDKYSVNRLVYYESFEEIGSAIVREKQIKGGSRKKKVLLISRLNPAWIDLYDRV